MKITIDVPELKCAKCGITAPLHPVFLYARGAIPPQFREALTAVVKERADVHAADDGGRTWEAFADDKPVGWTKGPGQVDLCAACTMLWLEAGKTFLMPPEPSEKLEAELLPPPPVTKDRPSREMTVSEILSSKQYENSTPVMNSMMPPTRK